MKIKFNSGRYNPRVRIIALATAMALVFGLVAVRLVYFQIVHGEDLLATARENTSTTITVQAARGDIVDRYGRKLATSVSAYNVVFDYGYTDHEHINQSIFHLISLFRKNGVAWNQPAPITRNADGSYSFIETSEDDQAAIETMTSVLELNVYATAENCVDKMFRDYNINYGIEHDENNNFWFSDSADPDDIAQMKQDLGLSDSASAADCVAAMQNSDDYNYYNDQDAFDIALVRYNMEAQEFSLMNQYTFASNISIDMVVQVSELSSTFPGVTIAQEQERTYTNNSLGSCFIGNIGPMYAEDYAVLKDDPDYNYAMNDYIGKFGIEKVYEEDLRGQKGRLIVTQNSDGDVVDSIVDDEAETGHTVRLTIDMYFQQLVSELLANHIASSPVSAAGYTPRAGAAVVMDNATGEILAAVSYPSYDLNTYNAQYNSLADKTLNPGQPLVDRCFVNTYRPGSTFKTVVATAGLETGQITRNSTITCTRVYRYYLNQGSSFAPTCLGYHGAINVIGALEVSCNIFFYELGRRLGIDTIDQYATYMGLGTYESTSGSDNPNGLELSNGRSSNLTSPENTEAAGGTWYEGNVVQAAIGQMDTAVTPLQMCLQASTIANHGTRYASHLVKSIETYDGTVLEETQPEVINQFDMQESTYEAVRDGMIAAATRTNIGLSSSELGYSVAVKTGTPQVDSGGVRTNNCAIAFTEGGPNISISVMLEDGTNANRLIRQIIDAYNQAQAQAQQETATHYPQELNDVLSQ